MNELRVKPAMFAQATVDITKIFKTGGLLYIYTMLNFIRRCLCVGGGDLDLSRPTTHQKSCFVTEPIVRHFMKVNKRRVYNVNEKDLTQERCRHRFRKCNGVVVCARCKSGK